MANQTACRTALLIVSSLVLSPMAFGLSVEGRVLNWVTQEPIPNVEVTATCLPNANARRSYCRDESTRTSADGNFQLDHLQTATRYLVQAKGMPGLVSVRTSQVEVDFTPMLSVSGITLKLAPESSLSGKVIEKDSRRPRANIQIALLKQSPSGAFTKLQIAAKTMSSKEGAYEFAHLTPGNYYVATAIVKQHTERQDDVFTLYSPAAQSLESAISTHVDMGQDYHNINLELMPLTPYRIQGRAQTDAFEHGTFAKLELHLDSRDASGVMSLGNELTLQPDGTFQADVLPGAYTLRLIGTTTIAVQKGSKTAGAVALHLLSRQNIEVTAHGLYGLVMLIYPPFSVKGRIALDESPDAKIDARTIALKPVDPIVPGGLVTTTVQPDGTFIFSSCDAATYAVRFTPPAGTYVKTMTFNGMDAATHLMDLSNGSGGELDILLRSGTASVTARPQDVDSWAGAYDVDLIPDGWNNTDLQAVLHAALKDGKYSLQGLAPGRYTAVATAGVNRSLWQNAVFVREMQSNGLQFDLAENDQKQISVVPVTGDEVTKIELRLGLY